MLCGNSSGVPPLLKPGNSPSRKSREGLFHFGGQGSRERQACARCPFGDHHVGARALHALPSCQRRRKAGELDCARTIGLGGDADHFEEPPPRAGAAARGRRLAAGVDVDQVAGHRVTQLTRELIVRTPSALRSVAVEYSAVRQELFIRRYEKFAIRFSIEQQCFYFVKVPL